MSRTKRKNRESELQFLFWVGKPKTRSVCRTNHSALFPFFVFFFLFFLSFEGEGGGGEGVPKFQAVTNLSLLTYN